MFFIQYCIACFYTVPAPISHPPWLPVSGHPTWLCLSPPSNPSTPFPVSREKHAYRDFRVVWGQLRCRKCRIRLLHRRHRHRLWRLHRCRRQRHRRKSHFRFSHSSPRALTTETKQIDGEIEVDCCFSVVFFTSWLWDCCFNVVLVLLLLFRLMEVLLWWSCPVMCYFGGVILAVLFRSCRFDVVLLFLFVVVIVGCEYCFARI